MYINIYKGHSMMVPSTLKQRGVKTVSGKCTEWYAHHH